ncbi:hypothetical protein GUJ93_ZPchr0012g20137 [Zizania palustris]|uniref:Uncharacterized protein n=1 Tax=Zizania palustris TaxID=103762 RepID=A0A8J5WRU0_ZIZPA|nr:hypothetical protein GUJ93_ZPchr0012g20137 [Zizania palustris]
MAETKRATSAKPVVGGGGGEVLLQRRRKAGPVRRGCPAAALELADDGEGDEGIRDLRRLAVERFVLLGRLLALRWVPAWACAPTSGQSRRPRAGGGLGRTWRSPSIAPAPAPASSLPTTWPPVHHHVRRGDGGAGQWRRRRRRRRRAVYLRHGHQSTTTSDAATAEQANGAGDGGGGEQKTRHSDVGHKSLLKSDELYQISGFSATVGVLQYILETSVYPRDGASTSA